MTVAAARDHVGDGLAWRESGEGPETVVFLHGLGTTRTSWDRQLADLSHRWRCVAWDMPGYGDSTPLSPLTFAAIADSLVALLDRLDADRAHLVGLSFGGMHALHTALRHPDRVARMVLVGTSPAFGLDGTDPDAWRRARTARLDEGETVADIAPAVLASVAGPNLDDATLAHLVGSFARIPEAGLRAACELLPHHDVRDRLDQIGQPTLVVVGEHDHETPLAYARALVDGLGDARLMVIPGAGHLVPAEAPDEFDAAVGAFLAAEGRTDG